MYATQFIICVLLSVAMPTWSCRVADDVEPEDDGVLVVVSRSEWDARSPVSNSTLSVPVKNVFIHHTAGFSCHSQDFCSSTVRSIQDYHMDSNGWDDIGYNFLIGEDGKAYEGRGWDHVGAHTHGYNDNGIGIAFMGTFINRKPNTEALDAAQDLIAKGVSLGKLSKSYTLRGHRDVVSTTCPGNSLYTEIQTWSNYD